VSCSTMGLISTPAALAGGPGGSAPGSTGEKPAPVHKIHLFPVTARTPTLLYAGPVYERTTAGTVVPFQPPAGGLAAMTPGPVASTASTAANAAGGATAPTASAPTPTLGQLPGPVPRPELLVPGTTARYVDGLGAAPLGAPAAVQQIIWAANELIGLPYIYGGGHQSFTSSGYDCSGTVSFALHGASLLSTPEDSSEFETWGSHGLGRWVTVFSNPGHAYMTVAGLRLDTSAADDPSNQQGPRWRPLRPANPGFVTRHPLGL
jgi:cell wall-associated NlpC family hydrolase